MTLREKLRGESHKLPLFLPVNGMNRAPELPGPARLDFDEHQHLAVFCHEVQFSQRGPKVSGYNTIAFPAQVPFSLRLSFLPKEPPGVKNSHALVRRMNAARPDAAADSAQ